MDVTKHTSQPTEHPDEERWYVLSTFGLGIKAKAELEAEARRRLESGLSPWRVFIPMIQAFHGHEGNRRRIHKPVLPNVALVRARLYDIHLWKRQHPYQVLHCPANDARIEELMDAFHPRRDPDVQTLRTYEMKFRQLFVH